MSIVKTLRREWISRALRLSASRRRVILENQFQRELHLAAVAVTPLPRAIEFRFCHRTAK